MNSVWVPKQKVYKQAIDPALERSTSTEDVDHVPHLKGTPYLSRIVDNDPIGNPLKLRISVKIVSGVKRSAIPDTI